MSLMAAITAFTATNTGVVTDVGAASHPTGGRRAGQASGRSDGAIRGKIRPGSARPGSAAGRALRHLDDGQLERLRDAVATEVRRRSRPDGKTPDRQTHRRPAQVTPGQERLVLAAFASGLKPATTTREFRLSRAEVESVVVAAKPGRR